MQKKKKRGNKNNWTCHKNWLCNLTDFFFSKYKWKLLVADTKKRALMRKVPVYSAVLQMTMVFQSYCITVDAISLSNLLSFYNLPVHGLWFIFFPRTVILTAFFFLSETSLFIVLTTTKRLLSQLTAFRQKQIDYFFPFYTTTWGISTLKQTSSPRDISK